MQRVSILSIVKKKMEAKVVPEPVPIPVPIPATSAPRGIAQKVCASCDAIYIEQ
jgi:hypothetical protein